MTVAFNMGAEKLVLFIRAIDPRWRTLTPRHVEPNLFWSGSLEEGTHTSAADLFSEEAVRTCDKNACYVYYVVSMDICCPENLDQVSLIWVRRYKVCADGSEMGVVSYVTMLLKAYKILLKDKDKDTIDKSTSNNYQIALQHFYLLYCIKHFKWCTLTQTQI